ncbi:MAG: hypothetical protein U0794_14090, partial [Isosphaeraceae bacterium]
MTHCIATIVRLVQENRGDARSIFQIGYNLGRLSEITGLGREPFWDRWKDAVCAWKHDQLLTLALDLQQLHPDAAPHSRVSESSPP